MEIVILSIRQPWASLIVNGHKDIENRKWQTPYRGELYIHAGAKSSHGAKAIIEMEHGIELPMLKTLPHGGLIGKANLVDIVRHSSSRWFEGPYGWVLRNARRIDFIPMKGQLRLWHLPVWAIPLNHRHKL